MCRKCNRVFCNGLACCAASGAGVCGALTGLVEGVAATLCGWFPPVVGSGGEINPGATLARNMGGGAGICAGGIFCLVYVGCTLMEARHGAQQDAEVARNRESRLLLENSMENPHPTNASMSYGTQPPSETMQDPQPTNNSMSYQP